MKTRYFIMKAGRPICHSGNRSIDIWDGAVFHKPCELSVNIRTLSLQFIYKSDIIIIYKNGQCKIHIKDGSKIEIITSDLHKTMDYHDRFTLKTTHLMYKLKKKFPDFFVNKSPLKEITEQEAFLEIL